MPTIYISLGSNINKEQNTRAGINALKQVFGELTLSSVYESEAVGFDGDAFYNMVIACHVDDAGFDFIDLRMKRSAERTVR